MISSTYIEFILIGLGNLIKYPWTKIAIFHKGWYVVPNHQTKNCDPLSYTGDTYEVPTFAGSGPWLETMMKIMILLLTFIGVVASLPLGDYNVTFPCGNPVNNQRCRFPGEYCDVIQSSCSPCNEDICREQDSDPSCRAFCYGWYPCIIILIKEENWIISKAHVTVKYGDKVGI